MAQSRPGCRCIRKEAEAGREVFRKVVNISSIAGLYGNAGQASYSSAKASLVGLTRTMCKEWGRYKVNVNCVAFGLINTRLTQPIEAQQNFVEHSLMAVVLDQSGKQFGGDWRQVDGFDLIDHSPRHEGPQAGFLDRGQRLRQQP